MPAAGDPVEIVRSAWRSATEALGGSGEAAAVSGAELVAQYQDGTRRYHDLEHVAAVVRDSAELLAGSGTDARERACVTIAACGHDVVYTGRAGEDERASAAWVGTALARAGIEGARVDRVRALILATAEHAAPAGDAAAAALLDADLAILGSAPGHYAAYMRSVRAEYAHVDADGWRRGRGAVLRELLGRAVLYRTDDGRARWDGPARANMRAELAQLAGTTD